MRTTLDDAYAGWIEWLRATGAGANRTISVRLLAVKHLAADRGIDPRDITSADVIAYLGREGLSKNTRHAYFGHLRAWCRWLVETDQLERDPMGRMRRPSAQRGTPRPLPDDVIRAALEVATGRTRSYVLLGLYAGLRVHEIAKVRGEDIGPDRFVVLGKGQQLWEIPTHPVLWELAQTMPESGWWFPSPTSKYGHVHGTTVTAMIGRLLRSIGSNGHAHQLRHTYGTEVLRSSGGQLRVAQELLRHQSPATTAIYTKVDDSERRAAVLALPGWAA